VSLSANPLIGLGLPGERLVKQLTPLYVVIGYNPLLSLQREERLYLSISPDEGPSSSAWKKLNASYVMSATVFPPRCKDKNYLAKNVQCELYFFAKVVLFF